MANHKSAEKRIRSSAKKRKRNTHNESRIRTVFNKALNATDKEEGEKIYKEAVSVLDRAASKGYLHKNNAARKKAALTKHFNSLAAPAPAAE
jgi:small subunit ribosomal protein S20